MLTDLRQSQPLFVSDLTVTSQNDGKPTTPLKKVSVSIKPSTDWGLGGWVQFFRARSQIPVHGLTRRALGGGARHGILQAKSWNKVYSMRRYPFMNNNSCQIYFILLPNLLVWIEIIDIQKLVTHVMHVPDGQPQTCSHSWVCPSRICTETN